MARKAVCIVPRTKYRLSAPFLFPFLSLLLSSPPPNSSPPLFSSSLLSFLFFSFYQVGLMYPRLPSKSLHKRGWPWTSNPCAIISWVLGLWVHATRPVLCDAEDWAHGFVHPRKALYKVSFTPSPESSFLIGILMSSSRLIHKSFCIMKTAALLVMLK